MELCGTFAILWLLNIALGLHLNSPQHCLAKHTVYLGLSKITIILVCPELTRKLKKAEIINRRTGILLMTRSAWFDV